MDEILEGLDGCVGIADDICVFGATQEEHDERLVALLEVANSSGLVFNSAKCTIKQHFDRSSVTFTAQKAFLLTHPKYTTFTRCQCHKMRKTFMGLMTYMGCFIRNLSQRASILRDLPQKDVPFEWGEDHQVVFNELKAAITHEARMVHYDVKKPITLEVDASMKGLGAALVQEEKPVAFASKTLTKNTQTTAISKEKCSL